MWDVLLSNGLTAEESLTQALSEINELHRLHGLAAGEPLIVTATTRVAGTVSQTITEAGGAVTVEVV